MRKPLILALTLLAALAASAYDHSAPASTGQTLYFTFTSATTAKLVAGSTRPEGRLTLPSSVEGRTVNEIDRMAFADCTGLTSVSIPGTIRTIGVRAFTGCTSLTSAYLAEGVSTISMGAFISCTALDTIEVPSTLTKIGSGAIGNTAFESTHGRPLYLGRYLVYVPDTTEGTFTVADTAIGIADLALNYCHITQVSLPAGLRFIGDNAFADCLWLDTVILHCATPPSIESYSFRNNAEGLVCIVPCGAAGAYQSARYWSSLRIDSDSCVAPPVGIAADRAADSPRVSLTPTGVRIAASAGLPVVVSDMTGRTVGTATSMENLVLPLPASGFYIVSVGGFPPTKVCYLK